jgi:hypothetical protein
MRVEHVMTWWRHCSDMRPALPEWSTSVERSRVQVTILSAPLIMHGSLFLLFKWSDTWLVSGTSLALGCVSHAVAAGSRQVTVLSAPLIMHGSLFLLFKWSDTWLISRTSLALGCVSHAVAAGSRQVTAVLTVIIVRAVLYSNVLFLSCLRVELCPTLDVILHRFSISVRGIRGTQNKAAFR